MLSRKRERRLPEAGKEVIFVGISIFLCLLRATLVYCSNPSVIISIDLFHSKKNPSLNNKLFHHPSYFDNQGKLSPEFEWEQEVLQIDYRELRRSIYVKNYQTLSLNFPFNISNSANPCVLVTKIWYLLLEKIHDVIKLLRL